ncbi:MAG: hypothetical protein IPG02_17700 [Ignavibacteria bacterium]|nr:hypothetical protein [Ignavibacteria bacterium]
MSSQKAEPILYYKRSKSDVQLIDVDVNGKKISCTWCKALRYQFNQHPEAFV